MNHRQLLEERVLLRPDEVADLIGKSKETVYRLVRAGVLDAVRNGHARITAESVREYIGIQRKIPFKSEFQPKLSAE